MTANTQIKLANAKTCVDVGWYEYERIKAYEDRCLYLYGEISNIDCDDKGLYFDASMVSKLTEKILDYNRMDDGVAPEKRKPVRLYIHSPGGDVTEGFALVGAIEISKTPIYTINVGECCSMAFLICIVGAKRFTLPHSVFMMHEPSGLVLGKFSDMEDKITFNKRFNASRIKDLVLKHSNMTEKEYNSVSKKDYYMLPEDALKHGFIDEIVTDIDTIL